MGLPDNRDVEPIRDGSIDDYNNQPDFVMNQIEENGQMDVDVEDLEDNNGYLRLRTFENGDEYQPANDSDSSESDEDEENEYHLDDENFAENIPPEPAGVPSIVSSDSELQAQVWNTPRTHDDTIELNTEKTQQILKAMSKFSLPNVPAWANEVDPGELVQRIKNKQAPSDKNWSFCTWLKFFCFIVT